jgi:choline dehydrogenase-like flavoprotein
MIQEHSIDINSTCTAGPSGCVVASRLAHSASRPSVLLLEAGGQNDSVVHLSATERMNVAFSPSSKLNWGRKKLTTLVVEDLEEVLLSISVDGSLAQEMIMTSGRDWLGMRALTGGMQNDVSIGSKTCILKFQTRN